MKKILFMALSFLMVISLSFVIGCKKVEKPFEMPKQVAEQSTQENIGEKLFNEHCIMCHSSGSGIKAIKRSEDIVNTMRNPKTGMPIFDKKEISDEDARVIANYIFLSILSKK